VSSTIHSHPKEPPVTPPAADAPTAGEQPRAEEPEEVVDADVVDEPAEDAGAELVVRESQAALTSARIIQGETPGEVIEKATQIANAMKHLVEAQGFAVDVGGRKPHLEIGAWQALGVLLGALGGEALHAEVVYSRPLPEKTVYHVHEIKKKWGGPKGQRQVVETTELDYDVEGYDWEAEVEVKTAAGVVVGREEGMVSRTESSWAKKPDPALKSMASTRAASRAYRASLGWVVAIAGYNPTPAEEMPVPPAAKVLPFGMAAPDPQLATSRQAIAYLLDPVGGSVKPGDEPVQFALDEIAKITEKAANEAGFAKYLPAVALGAVVRVARAAKNRRPPGASDGAAPAQQAPAHATPTAEPGVGDPAGETEEDKREREAAERIADEA
jgi:hypothetical protein